jgi:hypothetical protein
MGIWDGNLIKKLVRIIRIIKTKGKLVNHVLKSHKNNT